ncbi:MAG: glutamate racemase [Desulfobulbaceae bacterium BRH_c16a]|nr:MAG: glutamate racemase [Desulfobulbaceae bacterium BRH_c16a]
MIGIFDSGVGGMTVARAVELLLPQFPLLYLGDIARSPYGTKSDRTIVEYSVENTKFLIDKGATIIVIACNSASSVATDRLRREFSLPIIEVITPAVEQALAKTKTGRIGIIGTQATIRSTVYEKKILAQQPEYSVISSACPLLVPLVEEGWMNKKETKMILRRYLHRLKECQVDTLVLGCTHYPLLKHLIQPRIGRKVTLIDSSLAMAEYLQGYLRNNPDFLPSRQHEPRENRYFVTDITESTRFMAEKIFDRPIDLQPAE